MASRAGRNPFPGFRPFEEEESGLFFGRREAIYELVDRLGTSTFLAVLGTSGTGKSSLVRCGALPALHQGLMGHGGTGWRVAQMRPRNDPIGQLARSLADVDLLEPQGRLSAVEIVEGVLRRDSLGLVDLVRRSRLGPRENLLVFVDQFEELFRFAGNIPDRGKAHDDERFVKLLLEASAHTRRELASADARAHGGIFVILTVRSDFLGECTRYRELADRVNEGFFLVPFMSREERRETIEGPVAVAGGRITPRLVHRFLNDAGEDPSRLPILQHALRRTWAAWERRVRGGTQDGGFLDPTGLAGSEHCAPEALDLCDYLAAGGVDGALDRHLEHILTSDLDESQRELASRAFRRLTETLPDGRTVRRAATFVELRRVTGAGAADLETVVEAFRAEGRTFLTPLDEPLARDTLIDISHESLIRSWGRLRRWMEEEAERAATYRALSEAADRREDDPEAWGRYRDPELQRALDWWRAWSDADLARAWAAPYDRRAGREDGLRRSVGYLRDSERARTRSRAGVAALIGLAIGGLAGWAELERRSALREERGRIIELARAQGQEDPLEGALLLSALSGEEDIEGRGLAAGVELAARTVPTAMYDNHGDVAWVDADTAGRRALMVGVDGTFARLLDVGSGRASELPADDRLRLGVLSADGGAGTLVFEAGPARADLADGWTALTIPPDASFLHLSEDRTRLLAVYRREATHALGVCVWRLDGAAADSAECPGGRWLPHPRVRDARFTGGGRHVASWSADPAQVRVWALEGGGTAGALIDSIPLHSPELADGPFRNADYDPDAGRVAAASDGVVFLWDSGALEEGAEACTLPHEGQIVFVSFLDGDRLLSASDDGTVRLWSLASSGCPEPRESRVYPVAPVGVKVPEAALRTDRELLMMVGTDRTVRIWCVPPANGESACRAPGRLELTLKGHREGVVRARFIGASRWVVTADRGGETRVWSLDGTAWFRTLRSVPDSTGKVGQVAFAASGRFVVESDLPAYETDADTLAEVRVADLDTGELRRRTMGEPWALATDAAGDRVAIGLTDRALLWTADAEAPVAVSYRGGRALALSTGGERVLSATNDTVFLSDALTGAVLWRTGFAGRAASGAFHPTGTPVVGSNSGRVAWWENETTLVELFDVRADRADTLPRAVDRLAFSPSGGHLAVELAPTGVVVLSATSRPWAEGGDGPPSFERAVGRRSAFLGDSVLLLTAEGHVRAADVRTNEALFEFPTPRVTLLDLHVPSGGGRVLTWTRSSDGSEIREWPLTWQTLVDRLNEATHAPARRCRLPLPERLRSRMACDGRGESPGDAAETTESTAGDR